MKRTSKRNRPCTAVEMSWGNVYRFDSLTECAEELNLSKTHVCEIMKGKRCSHKGYTIYPFNFAHSDNILIRKFTELNLCIRKDSSGFIGYRCGFKEAMALVERVLGEDVHDKLMEDFIEHNTLNTAIE